MIIPPTGFEFNLSDGTNSLIDGAYVPNNSGVLESLTTGDVATVNLTRKSKLYEARYPKLSDGIPGREDEAGLIYEWPYYTTPGTPLSVEVYKEETSPSWITGAGSMAFTSHEGSTAATIQVGHSNNGKDKGWPVDQYYWAWAYYHVVSYTTHLIDLAALGKALVAQVPRNQDLIPVGMVSSDGKIDYIKEGLITPSQLQDAYYDYYAPGEVHEAYLFQSQDLMPEVSFDKHTQTLFTAKAFYDPQAITINAVTGAVAKEFHKDAEKTTYYHAHVAYPATQSNRISYTLTVDASTIVYFAPKSTVWGGEGEGSGLSNKTELLDNGGSGGGSGGADIPLITAFKTAKDDDAGSYTGGLNIVNAFSGNTVIPYRAVFMSGANYNSFVNAGGGVVSESGLYPNDRDSIYITNIKLSVEGSSMTVLQNSDFDATPVLVLNEKVFGYIINASGDYECSFAGFVFSISKHLEGQAEYIQYECRDLTGYLNQLSTPSYFIYKPPSIEYETTALKYDYIIKQLLMKIGLTNADIDIPTDINAPELEYNFTPLNNVLQDLTSYMGKYVYYTTKNGILTIRATDSGSVVQTYRVPSRGEAIGTTHKLCSFNPVYDASLSRSKIVMTGDFIITEIIKETTYPYPISGYSGAGHTATLDPAKEIDPQDNKQTGMFYYRDTKTSSIVYYFMFRPGKTIVTPLVSNPEVSAEFTIIGYSDILWATNEVETRYKNLSRSLEIDYLSDDLGNSFVYIYRNVQPPAIDAWFPSGMANYITYPKYVTLSHRYCVRDESPLTITQSTGLTGGIEVLRMPEFKKTISSMNNRDDTSLMQKYLDLITEYYKPIHGGRVVVDSLENHLNLLDKVSITNTGLTSAETTGLVIHSINYDLIKRQTTLELSDRVFMSQPFFDMYGELQRKESQKALTLDSVNQKIAYRK